MEGEKGMEVRYYICKHCGNIVEKVKDKGVPVICCGEPMQELKAGVTDAPLSFTFSIMFPQCLHT